MQAKMAVILIAGEDNETFVAVAGKAEEGVIG